MRFTLLVALMLPTFLCAQIVPGHSVRRYSSITDPVRIKFASDGSIYAGRDNFGSGGTNGDPVKIHRIANLGVSVQEIGTNIQDPDAVVFDQFGWFTGLTNSALVGSFVSGSNGRLTRVAPDNTTTSIYLGGGCTNPSDFLLTASNRLLVADATGNRVCHFTSITSVVTMFTQTGVVFIDQNISGQIITCGSTGQIQHRSSTGAAINTNVASVPGTGSIAFGVSNSGSFAGNYYAIRGGNLYQITPMGVITTLGTGFNSECYDIEFGPDQAMYVSSFGTDEVLRIAPSAANTLDGSVTFENNVGSPIPNVTLDLHRVGDGVLVSSTNVSLSGGNFSGVAIPETGCFYLSAKTGTWLRSRRVVDARGSIILPVHLSLKNGDCNADGIVDISDYSVLAAAFDATPESPNWDVRADLNREGIVDIADYSILATNFDAVDE